MQISRRTALLTGAAAIVPLPAMASLSGSENDADLFEAIGEWRKTREAYHELDRRHDAMIQQADSEMPAEYYDLERACTAAYKAVPYSERTFEQHKRLEKLRRALSPHRQQHARRLDALGYSDDAAMALLNIAQDACEAAFAIPALTLAGLRAKIDMQLLEWSDDPFAAEREVVEVLVADIRRLSDGGAS